MSKVKLLLYCTKAKPYLNDYRHFEFCNKFVIMNKNVNALNGKIVAECDCDKVEEIFCEMLDNGVGSYPIYYTETLDCIEESSCLNTNDLANYLSQKIGGEKVGYALHLSNIKIYDKPKELNEYYKDNFLQELNDTDARVYKAPQNMCRVYDEKGNMYILISIQPQWLCKILNGEKTIEVRRQIVKELKEQIENE